MKGICSSETSVDFQRTTRRYIPEDGTLQLSYSVYLGNACFYGPQRLFISGHYPVKSAVCPLGFPSKNVHAFLVFPCMLRAPPCHLDNIILAV
jgi:hypothetical protein